MSGACVLRDYAVLADGERGALINPQGEISWMCFPRWHSDAVFSTLIGGHGKEHVDDLLAQVGLAERGDTPYKSYSLGMKQRLGIAASLLSDPDLLILDEPTNGLDPAGIHEMRDFLRGLGNKGKTVFVSSHLLAEVQRMCDREAP